MEINSKDIKPKISGSDNSQPFDLVPLPTRGLIYSSGPLMNREALEVFYLNAVHEDILTSPNLVQSDKMVDTLLQAVLKDKSINAADLALVDRNAILVWLRSTGYGPEYPIKLKCRECGEKFTHEFNLATLDTKYLDIEPDENGWFDFTMPKSNTLIKFSLMTGRDDAEVNTMLKKKKTKLGNLINSTVTAKLAKIIKAVDGNDDPGVIRKFIETLTANDSRSFRQYASEILPGVVFKQDVECPHCGELYEEDVPILASFFWPDINN